MASRRERRECYRFQRHSCQHARLRGRLDPRYHHLVHRRQLCPNSKSRRHLERDLQPICLPSNTRSNPAIPLASWPGLQWPRNNQLGWRPSTMGLPIHGQWLLLRSFRLRSDHLLRPSLRCRLQRLQIIRLHRRPHDQLQHRNYKPQHGPIVLPRYRSQRDRRLADTVRWLFCHKFRKHHSRPDWCGPWNEFARQWHEWCRGKQWKRERKRW